MKKLRYALIILLTISMTHVVAISFDDIYKTGCTVGSKLGDDWSWVCRAGKLIANLSSDFEAIYKDFAKFAEELFNDIYDDAITTLAGQIDTSVIDAALTEIENALKKGPEELKDTIRKVSKDLRLSHLLELKNAKPADLIAALKKPNELRTYKKVQQVAEKVNPNVLMTVMGLQQQQENVVKSQGEAEVAHLENQKLAKQVIEDTTVRDTMAEVLAPKVAGVGGGTASSLEEAAKTAVSTRAAIQVLSEGIADLMRQEATLSGNINEHLKILAQQQVMTSWQLKLQTQILNEQLNQEIEQQKQELENAIAKSYEGSVSTAQQLTMVGNRFKTINKSNLPTFSALGW